MLIIPVQQEKTLGISCIIKAMLLFHINPMQYNIS